MMNPLVAQYAEHAAAYAQRNPQDPTAQQQAHFWAGLLMQQRADPQQGAATAAPSLHLPAPTAPTPPLPQTQPQAVPSNLFSAPVGLSGPQGLTSSQHGSRELGGQSFSMPQSTFHTPAASRVHTPRRSVNRDFRADLEERRERRGRDNSAGPSARRARTDSHDGEPALQRGFGTRMLTVGTQLKRLIESISRQAEEVSRFQSFQNDATSAVQSLQKHAEEPKQHVSARESQCQHEFRAQQARLLALE